MLTEPISLSDLSQFCLSEDDKKQIVSIFNQTIQKHQNGVAWQVLQKKFLSHFHNFNLDLFVFNRLYPNWQHDPAPIWLPSSADLTQSNIALSMKELNMPNYSTFHQWSTNQFDKFWDYAIKKMKIKFHKPYTNVWNSQSSRQNPEWLPGAQLNIVESCFQADKSATAIVYSNESGHTKKVTYAVLELLVNQIANSIKKHGFKKGDAIAIDMPMNIEAVAIYLGIIKAGCVVVSIADSFAPQEIALRLSITKARAIFTQDYYMRDNKQIFIYQKIIQANAPKAIVLNYKNTDLLLRDGDLSWQDFLTDTKTSAPVFCNPWDHMNILFSSGTTGEPKAIVWTHTTPIKCATDAYFHHNVQPYDIFLWPTNLGWMMGPWLVFACLINHATIAIFDGSPTCAAFGKFIQDEKINLLGVIPSIVKHWRTHQTMEQFNWYSVKLFSSTGECSNVIDMLYLMWLAHYKPIIEYCGGTEIGGGYITSTVLDANAPATFTTPALGLSFVMLDENQNLTHNGEVAIISPSIGLSNELLHRDHKQVYFADMPKYQNILLRRHGDHIEKIDNKYFRALGRIDDTMNLGGIKISAAEIERVLNTLEGIQETAAIAVTEQTRGPSQLVIYCVIADKTLDQHQLKRQMQQTIKEQLNPLFKIYDVVFIKSLPRTASNKIMRRILRENYTKQLS